KPNQVTELPVTKPWKTLKPLVVAVVSALVAIGTTVPAGSPGAPVEANVCAISVQPDNGVGQTVCGAPGPNAAPAPAPVAGASPEPGSSISNSASETLLPPEIGNSRLVTAVFRKIVMLTAGITLPGVEGAPPVQTRVISPTVSVKPSARIVGVLETLAAHDSGVPPMVCALAKPANRARTANAVMHLRESTISSFSLNFE